MPKVISEIEGAHSESFCKTYVTGIPNISTAMLVLIKVVYIEPPGYGHFVTLTYGHDCAIH
eukprot:639710-Ditylum_brightwellii.AAC.1